MASIEKWSHLWDYCIASFLEGVISFYESHNDASTDKEGLTTVFLKREACCSCDSKGFSLSRGTPWSLMLMMITHRTITHAARSFSMTICISVNSSGGTHMLSLFSKCSTNLVLHFYLISFSLSTWVVHWGIPMELFDSCYFLWFPPSYISHSVTFWWKHFLCNPITTTTITFSHPT